MIDPVVDWFLRRLPAEQRRRLSFGWRYRRGRTPWDTNQTPPEVYDFLRDPATRPGRALDLGCGTGTNVLTLAEHGWTVTGVDYVGQAIDRARERVAGRQLPVRFFQGDVTRLDQLPLEPPFDYFLDIGCFHSLTPDGEQRYADSLARMAAPGALFMLYAGTPRASNTGLIGVSPERIRDLFAPRFHVERQELGEDSGAGWPRGWYWLREGAG